MPDVSVKLGDRSYVVTVERGAVDRAASYLPAGRKVTRVLVASDTNVAPLYAERVAASFEGAGLRAAVVAVPAGESHKTLAAVATLYSEMVKGGLDRASLVAAVGGGVVGDMAGFAAATYMRGVRFLQVPTTIVAQVDSSIGGKTGVDLPDGKNLVGAFHQPVAVVADPETLATLPEREARAGLAEVIKHGVIRDADYFSMLEEEGEALVPMRAEVAERVILRSVEIKAEVVSADEREGGVRAILNFGHTVGHALEAVTGYDEYLHGEAIAIGMVAAANVALLMHACDETVGLRIKRLLSETGLPIDGAGASAEAVMAAMARDKKALGGKARFVLPTRIGAVDIRDDVTRALLTKALAMTGFAA